MTVTSPNLEKEKKMKQKGVDILEISKMPKIMKELEVAIDREQCTRI